ncbi:gag-Pol polyprotein [Trichonephila clavipes]|nr:gag-Pol polyprotein [Trichonephila clavipes]
MPTTRAMEAQFQTLLEKLTEMNANMGGMKSELTTNIAEVNTKLTNVNEQISANKEELKSDLKGIGDKLTTMDKKFEEMEGRIESVENKFENKFVDIENKFENKFEDMESKLEAKIFEKPSIKLSTYDGKSSWQVYKTQFSIVADANQWDSQTKACQLAASLRADAADILQTLPETQRLDFDALVNALELRFGEKCEGLQQTPAEVTAAESVRNAPELATDVERLSHLAFSDCPTEVREVLALQHFIDGVRDPEIRKLSNGGSQGLKGGPSVCYEIRGSPASNTKGQTPHTSRQRIGHVELRCGAVRATDEKLHE